MNKGKKSAATAMLSSPFLSDKSGDISSGADHSRASQKGCISASPKPKRNFLEGVKNTLRPKKSHDHSGARVKASVSHNREADCTPEETVSPAVIAKSTDDYAKYKPDVDSSPSVDSMANPSQESPAYNTS
jgi:hypothetical protein